MTQPTVLLGMINDAGIAKIVAQNLAFHGYEVIDFSLDSLNFEYPNLRTRLQTQWRKLLGNKQAKKEMMVMLKRQQLPISLANYPKIDYALFIRSDVYPDSFLREVMSRAKNMVNYQWDGVARFAAAQQQIAHFDRYYVFDSDDYALFEGEVLPATSFYFDHLPEVVPSEPDTIYYLGAHREDRKNAVIQFCQFAQQHDLKLNFQIACPKQADIKKIYPVDNIQFHEGISYQQNLQFSQQSGVLADFVISSHKGLSLRTFEAIGYQKKLITTNAEVAKYDFYHPDNMYIWDGKSCDGLLEFLARPYHVLDRAIREKYSFGNWLRYVFNIEPHQVIRLPEK